MQACLTRPIRGPSPDFRGRKGCGPRTTGPVLKQDSAVLSRTSSRHIIPQTKPIRAPRSPPSSDTPYESSDDDIIGPITPPPILRDLSGYTKRLRQRPKPYQKNGPNIIDRLCGEECLGCGVSKDLSDVQGDKTRLQRRIQRLSPEALAQAMIAVQADIEWRRVRAIAAALHVDAVHQHSKFLDITVQSEAETYVNAASEPLNTAIEALASCTTDELADRRNCSIAAYELDATSFVTADVELMKSKIFHYLFWDQMIAPPVRTKKIFNNFECSNHSANS